MSSKFASICAVDIHHKRIIHRDIAPDNVLLNSMNTFVISSLFFISVTHSELSLQISVQLNN